MRIHITGASGAGTTTLGKAVASQLSLPHLDADSYDWLPTSPPFKDKRSSSARLALLRDDLASPLGVVLSGSIVGWGPDIEGIFDLVVFLYLPADIRIARLRARELARDGAADPAFLDWAAQYDEGPSEGRSLAKHEAWLANLVCPVLRLDQDQTVEERARNVLRALTSLNRSEYGGPSGPPYSLG
jgi:hypothetical protein